MKPTKTAALDVVKMCCRVLDEKKAADVTVLDVAAQSSITDYLVIATATSEPHLRALRVELEKALDAGQVHLVGMETAQESGWMIIDAFDVMVHLFLPAARERYGLERLWRDAKEVSSGKLGRAAMSAVKKPRAKAPRKKAAAPTRARKRGKG
jgi:ribosome-associated protein